MNEESPVEEDTTPRSCTEEAPCEVRQGLGEQLARAHQTNAKLNRRCQAAEAAALQNVKACVGAGLSFSRTLANWYALRLTDELVHVLRSIPASALEAAPLGQPWARELAERIRRTIPEEASLLRWRQKQTQPKASVRDGELRQQEAECEVCHGPCQGH